MKKEYLIYGAVFVVFFFGGLVVFGQGIAYAIANPAIGAFISCVGLMLIATSTIILPRIIELSEELP